MELRLLRYFVAIAESGSISGAARSLYLYQPALSAALRVLERQVGGTLLNRGPHGVSLTPLGRDVLPRARQMLEDAERIADLSRRHRHQATPGKLRIGVPLPPMAAPLTAPLQALRQLGVESEFVYCDPWDAQGLLDGRFDVAVLSGPVHDERLLVARVAREPCGLLVGPHSTLLDIPEGELQPEDLSRARFPRVSEGVPRDWEFWWRCGPELNGDLGPSGAYVDSLIEAFLNIATGHSVAAYPASVEPFAKPWGLTFIPIPGKWAETAVCRTKKPSHPAAALILPADHTTRVPDPDPTLKEVDDHVHPAQDL